MAKFTSGPRPGTISRLEPLFDVVDRLGPAWEAESDPAARAALSATLAVTHKTLHKLLKPDETAEGRAVAVARKKDPAANENAESIVIHPLHRAGAPGLETTTSTTGASVHQRKESEE